MSENDSFLDGSMTTSDVVTYLGLKESQVRELVFRRQIPFTKTDRRLRFDQAALDAWLQEQPQRRRHGNRRNAAHAVPREVR